MTADTFDIKSAGKTPASAADPASEPDNTEAISTDSRFGLRRHTYRFQTWMIGVVAFGIILVLLVQARFILTSLIFAIILFSLATDAINAIARLHIGTFRVPNWLASILVFCLTAVFLIVLATFIVAQVNSVVATTVALSDQAISAVSGLFSFLGPETQAGIETSIRSVNLAGYLRSAAGQAGNLLSATTLVILFVGFLFSERIWFDTKLEKLMEDQRRAEQVRRIIRSIIRRINRYLVVKTAVSAVTGLAVYVIMLAFGLEFAVAMAVLTFALNYLPSIGSIIATVIVALIAYLQVPELGFTLLIFGIVTAVQFMLGSVIDPMLMGRTLRVSAFGIVMSMAFWSLVWGVPGAFLAVPILVAAMITCSHTPSARPLAILISRDGSPDFDEDKPSD